MKQLNCIAVFVIVFVLEVVYKSFMDAYHQVSPKFAPADCVAVESIKNFCFAPDRTTRMNDQGVDVKCPNGLSGHLDLDKDAPVPAFPPKHGARLRSL
jgi:hypothetical protein